MSDPPGNHSRPRNSRGGRNRNRNQNQRGPRQDQGRREERRDDRNSGRRRENPRAEKGERQAKQTKPPEKRQPPKSSKPGTWRKVLSILTLGLIRPKSTASHAGRDKGPGKNHPRPPREPRPSPVPAIDPASVDTDRLHVGNLSYDATESDLLDVFKGIGKVQSVDIVYNGRTHRSKGFGFVQMMSVADARRAVAELHGKAFMGRALQLGPARSRGRDEREADDDGDQAPAKTPF
jgi:hypothetical protein